MFEHYTEIDGRIFYKISFFHHVHSLSIPEIHLSSKKNRRNSSGNNSCSSNATSTNNSIRRMFSKGKSRKDKDSTTPTPQEEYRPYLEEDYIIKLTETDMFKIVPLPDGLDKNEWLAIHTIALFEHVNLLYGTICEYCTATGCPSMVAPGNRHYLWSDEKGKKFRCPAPQYVDYVMSFTQKLINDDSIFPTKFGISFPSTFEDVVKKIHRYLFHVIAHIYQCHFDAILCLQLHPHLNTVFLLFMSFNKMFNLTEEKELEVLDDLFQKIESKKYDDNSIRNESDYKVEENSNHLDINRSPSPSLPPPPSDEELHSLHNSMCDKSYSEMDSNKENTDMNNCEHNVFSMVT